MGKILPGRSPDAHGQATVPKPSVPSNQALDERTTLSIGSSRAMWNLRWFKTLDSFG